MNKKLSVLGLGPGNLDYLTRAGFKLIAESEIVIGGERQLEEIDELLTNQERYVMKKLDSMKKFVSENLNKNIVFIVSGDTGYYSLLTYLKKSFPTESFNVIPGISSFQYLFSKLEMTWEHYRLLSVHGRENDYVKALYESKDGVVLLTDESNNPIEICRNLVQTGFDNIEVIVGERLSYSDEKISRFLAQEYEQNIRKYEMNVTILRKV